MEEKKPGGATDVRTFSPLALAFVGDGVYGLMVRNRLVCRANRPVGELHEKAVLLVRAEAQAQAVTALLPMFSEEEAGVFRRGRNAHTSRSGYEYHQATGLEALFGYLYLAGRTERLETLFVAAMAVLDPDPEEGTAKS